MRKSTMAAALAFGAVAAAGLAGVAAGQESGTLFHVGTNTKHTNIAFVSEAEIETIHGTTNEIAGTVFFAFDDLKGKTSLTVPVASLRTGIPTRDEHLRSDQWLDAEKFPDITLTSSDIALTVKNAERGIYDAKLKGTLTIHGVARDRTLDATVVKLPESIAKKLGAGQWVKLTAKFDVQLADHDIEIPNPGQVGPKVSETWSVAVSLFATTAAPERRR